MDDTPENEAIEPTKSLFAGNPSAADDHAVAALEAITQVPAPYASNVELPEPEDTVIPSSEPEDAVAVEPEPIEVPVDETVDVPDNTPTGSVPEPVVEATEQTPIVDAEPAKPEPEEGSVEALLIQREAVDKALAEKRATEKRAVLDQIAVVARTYGITTADIATVLGKIPSPSRGTKAEITHRDDAGNTWTGRGRTPKWLKGKNPDDYLVKN